MVIFIAVADQGASQRIEKLAQVLELEAHQKEKIEQQARLSSTKFFVPAGKLKRNTPSKVGAERASLSGSCSEVDSS